MDLVSLINTVVFQPYRLTAELLGEIHAVGRRSPYFYFLEHRSLKLIKKLRAKVTGILTLYLFQFSCILKLE